ncbi:MULTISPECIES: hypothetical protein [Streptomyces]|uniref:hypothetical protein n=1 Tax=Streptomyces TaxID=1883 RepID=UPI0003053CAE|nr:MULTISPECIES: hypothetical protein [Streptomyces]MYS66352.1 hypothetical protein [Streptomyces sp. SID5473]
MTEQPCASCGETGLTEHERHTVELDEHGNHRPVVHRWTGACSHCSGSGTNHQHPQ